MVIGYILLSVCPIGNYLEKTEKCLSPPEDKTPKSSPPIKKKLPSFNGMEYDLEKMILVLCCLSYKESRIFRYTVYLNSKYRHDDGKDRYLIFKKVEGRWEPVDCFDDEQLISQILEHPSVRLEIHNLGALPPHSPRNQFHRPNSTILESDAPEMKNVLLDTNEEYDFRYMKPVMQTSAGIFFLNSHQRENDGNDRYLFVTGSEIYQNPQGQWTFFTPWSIGFTNWLTYNDDELEFWFKNNKRRNDIEILDQANLPDSVYPETLHRDEP